MTKYLVEWKQTYYKKSRSGENAFLMKEIFKNWKMKGIARDIKGKDITHKCTNTHTKR